MEPKSKASWSDRPGATFHAGLSSLLDAPLLDACVTFLLNLCQYISDQIDFYVYLPLGVIDLEDDNVRSDDPIFQKDIDQWVHRNLKELAIPEEKLLRVTEVSLEGRVQEILSKISIP